MRAVAVAALLAAGPALADWTVHPDPVFEGAYADAGDPSVIRQADGTYLMVHHCLDVERKPQGGAVCLAQSADGLAWKAARTGEGSFWVPGRLLTAGAGEAGWDQAHETPFALAAGEGLRLYLVGYPGAGFFADSPSSAIGLSEGARLEGLPPPVRILSGTGPHDRGGVTSPSVAAGPNGATLYYTGWSCAPSAPGCLDTLRLTLMAAPLGPDGRPVAAPVPVLGDPGLAWTNGGVSEAEVTVGPDGRSYLFFSSLPGPKGTPDALQRIGVAIAQDPLGPFRPLADPIVTPASVDGGWAGGGVLAPTVLFEEGRVRLWFHAFETGADGAIAKVRIGYAEHPWPIVPD